MEEFRYELKVPHDRVAVLIGKDGETKNELEDQTGAKISVDSKEGDVFIEGENPLELYTCRDIVRAISRGFNPDVAKLLLKQDFGFELIPLTGIAGKSKNALARLKGRIIGKEGKARITLEELTECHICVYGKTVGVIGELSYLAIARSAIDMLLKGSTHARVYRMLEQKRRERKRAQMLNSE